MLITIIVSLNIKIAAPLSETTLLGNAEEGFRVPWLDESAAEVDEAERILQTFYRFHCISLEDPPSLYYIFPKESRNRTTAW
jgi:hypothetical protein